MIDTSILKHLQNAPESQLDPVMKEKLNNITGLVDKDTVEGVFDVLQTSVYCGLASDLMVLSLEGILKMWCNQCKYNYDTMLKESAERCIKIEEGD